MKWLITLLVLCAPTVAGAEDKCTFAQVGDLDLVAGATTSTITIAGEKKCTDQLKSQVTLSSAASGSMVAAVEATAQGILLRVRDVPATLIGTVEWHVTPINQATDIGLISIRSSAIAIKQLIVTYGDRKLDAQQTGLATHTDQGWIAVAQHTAFKGDPSSKGIMNTAQLDIAPRMLHPAVGRWQIAGSTWGTSVLFQSNGECYFNPSRIRFAVARRLKSPLQARLQLLDAADKPLVDLDLVLASEARPESLPLPISDAIKIECKASHLIAADDTTSTAERGVSIAIDDDAFENRKCTLSVVYRQDTNTPEVKPASDNDDKSDKEASTFGASGAICKTTAQPLKRIAATDVSPASLFGDQALAITVTRGAKTGTTVVVMPHAEAGKPIPLDAPDGASSETGPYKVSVRLVSGKKDIVYRDGSLPSTDVDPRLTFDATLRPRGRLGLNHPVRIYFTFPISPASLRIPSRASELQSSKESPIIQNQPRAGAMFVVEPWDYDHDRNPFKIPVSFQLGISSTSFEDQLKNASFLVGVSADFPIVDKSFTETSIAIGVFYEVGLEDHFAKAHRGLLITAGLDLFRVLKSNKTSEKTE